jgi:hypothetical protein
LSSNNVTIGVATESFILADDSCDVVCAPSVGNSLGAIDYFKHDADVDYSVLVWKSYCLRTFSERDAQAEYMFAMLCHPGLDANTQQESTLHLDTG